MAPDIERLRTFSLVTALLLLAYVAAGVELESGAHISVFGIPFVIRRPEFLPLVLLLASSYGLIRYLYYGVMLHHTPHRRRKDLLQNLCPHGSYGKYKGSVFFGPSNFSTTTSTPDRAEIERQILDVMESFPKIGKVRVTRKIESRMVCDEEGDPYVVFDAEITIPIVCRLAALIQDIDYMAPVWLNLGALTWAVYRYMTNA